MTLIFETLYKLVLGLKTTNLSPYTPILLSSGLSISLYAVLSDLILDYNGQ